MSDGSPSEGQSTNPTSSDVINLAALEAACGEEGAQELLGIFVDSTRTLFERMDAALAQRDSKALKAVAHEMKGACGSIGANTMASLSKSMEQSALNSDWDLSAQLLRELKDDFESVCKFCEGVLLRSE